MIIKWRQKASLSCKRAIFWREKESWRRTTQTIMEASHYQLCDIVDLFDYLFLSIADLYGKIVRFPSFDNLLSSNWVVDERMKHDPKNVSTFEQM